MNEGEALQEAHVRLGRYEAISKAFDAAVDARNALHTLSKASAGDVDALLANTKKARLEARKEILRLIAQGEQGEQSGGVLGGIETARLAALQQADGAETANKMHQWRFVAFLLDKARAEVEKIAP